MSGARLFPVFLLTLPLGCNSSGVVTGDLHPTGERSVVDGSIVDQQSPGRDVPTMHDQSNCPAGTGDCNNNPADGCETNLGQDTSHCGKCGRSCLGGACQSGACQPVVLVPDLKLPASGGGIAVDSSTVYFTLDSSSGSGAVGKIGKSGGTMSWLLQGEGSPRSVLVDSGYLYWVDIGLNQVNRMALNGATKTTLATSPKVANALALEGNHLYWASNVAVMMMDTDGKNPVTMASNQSATSLAASSAGVFWTTSAGEVATQASPTTVKQLATGQNGATSIVLDAISAYWCNSSTGEVMSVSIYGGTPTPVAQGSHGAIALAIDASNVYWISNSSGEVYQAPRTGGAATKIASGQKYPFDIAIDNTAIYWITEVGPAVWRLAK